ncbi:hypothetical protein OTK01_000338 [Caldicellulosiruptor acetigenus]|uniref:hypothetical protein n=1 Tax=Caldicellulosiruptor acetigenus TaxID=301953 RepID=UPI0022A9B131|nr:hypothetical protein [Caldicellulosiruptor acetigenus]WAM36564.1 hypothetical protein OTK01_000338 [Caldicellulosiruptor acetigenus]
MVVCQKLFAERGINLSITQKEVETFLEEYRKYLLSQVEEIKDILQTLPVDAVERAFSYKDAAKIAEKLKYYHSMYQIGLHALEEVFGKNKISFSIRGVNVV